MILFHRKRCRLGSQHASFRENITSIFLWHRNKPSWKWATSILRKYFYIKGSKSLKFKKQLQIAFKLTTMVKTITTSTRTRLKVKTAKKISFLWYINKEWSSGDCWNLCMNSIKANLKYHCRVLVEVRTRISSIYKPAICRLGGLNQGEISCKYLPWCHPGERHYADSSYVIPILCMQTNCIRLW